MNKSSIWNAVRAFFSHSSNWTIIFGAVLGIVAAIVPRWAGLDNLTAVFDQLAILLPIVFGLIGGAQKYADAKSQGETSSYNQWLKAAEKDMGEEVGRAYEAGFEEGYNEATADMPEEDIDDETTKMDLPGGKKIGGEE